MSNQGGEYFIIREGIATYLCRKAEDGCWILAQYGMSGRWVKFRNPQFWRWAQYSDKWTDDPEAAYHSRPPLDKVEAIPREEVAAILLMAKTEGSG